MNRLLLAKTCLLLLGLALVAGCQRSTAPKPRINVANVDSLKKALGGSGEGKAAVVEVAAAEPTGWATISGKFTLVGAPPPRAPLNVDKDQHVCAPGGKPVLEEKVVVDGAGGIKDVVIYLTTKTPAGSDKWEHPDYAALKDAEVVFDQKNCVFLSHVFVMRSSQKLLIKNSDPVGHNTKVDPSAGSKTASLNTTIPAEQSTTYDPKGDSTIPNPVACTIHPWMSARILTRPNPYFAVTAADGTFEIKNVPAGVPLEFAVWQEGAGLITKATLNGKEEAWKGGKFKRTIADGATETLDVKLDEKLFKK